MGAIEVPRDGSRALGCILAGIALSFVIGGCDGVLDLTDGDTDAGQTVADSGPHSVEDAGAGDAADVGNGDAGKADAGKADAGMPEGCSSMQAGSPPEGPVTVRFMVFEYTSLETPVGTIVKACAGSDTGCEDALAQDDAPGDDGLFQFDLSEPEDVYFEIQAPGTVDTLAFTNERFITDTTVAELVLIAPTNFTTLGSVVGGGDSTKGAVLVEALDCGRAAAGVQSEIDDGTGSEKPFYFAGTLPDKNATETKITRNLSPSMKPRAVGGFVDVAPGYVTVRATLDGMDFGTVTVQARPGTLTLAVLHRGY